MKKSYNTRVEEITQLALDLGLDFFPVVFETIEISTMNNICSYGLPTRARHWSYGRSYDHQKTYGEMGFSKVFEVILNNNPSYAFMLDTNTEVQNLFIVAHCLAHSDFFKNNCMFSRTDRNMISHAAEHSGRVEDYIDRFGIEKVEHIMDIGFALDRHIDYNKNIYRKPYSKKQVKSCKLKYNEFDDLLGRKSSLKPMEKTIAKIPPHPEKDLLWFFINYAPLEDWESDILDIIREESFYFYPQMMTKILNEGFASYWHAEIMFHYNGLSSEEYINFVRDHERVVQPGGNPFRINPYYLGFRILKDVEKRWDEKYGKGAGKEKIFEIRKNEDDVSFLRNYLTDELVDDLNLFTYGYEKNYSKDFSGEKYIQIKERIKNSVIEELVKPLYNYGVPNITINEVGPAGDLVLKHNSEEIGTLDRKFASKVIEYIWDLWVAPVSLKTLDDDGSELLLCYDELGYDEVKIDEEKEEEEKEEHRIILI